MDLNELSIKIHLAAEKASASFKALMAYFGLDKELQEQIAAWENEGGSYE